MALILALIGLVGLAMQRNQPSTRNYKLLVGSVALALLITPTVWSGLTVLSVAPLEGASKAGPAVAVLAASAPQLPSASALNNKIITYLTSHATLSEYFLAVPSAMVGDDYILNTQDRSSRFVDGRLCGERSRSER